MAWDKTLPANSTKIRNYPTVLTDNFSAIEEGELTLKHWQVNFIERDAVPGAPPPTNDPTRADDTMILFSKQDPAAETELFFMDDQNPANIVQLSETGKLGSALTQLVLLNISFGSETTEYVSDNLVGYWATVDTGGNILSQSGGLSAVRDSTGRFTITFTTAQSDALYGVHLSVENNAGNSHVATYHTKTVNDFQITIVNQNASKLNNPFTVSIYGKRA